MYEENCQPLPEGDGTIVFRKQLREIQQRCGERPPPTITPDHVLQWADRNLQPPFVAVCRGLLLPVSRDDNLTHETPCLDRVEFTFSPVMTADEWRVEAQRKHPDLNQREASALQIMQDITALALPKNRQSTGLP